MTEQMHLHQSSDYLGFISESPSCSISEFQQPWILWILLIFALVIIACKSSLKQNHPPFIPLFYLISMVFTTYCSNAQQFIMSPSPTPGPISLHATGVYNDTLTIINGLSLVSWLDYSQSASISSYDGTWTETQFTSSGPPETNQMALRSSIVVQVEQLMYIINPSSRVSGYGDIHGMYAYNLQTNTFAASTKPLFPAFRGCAVYNDMDNFIFYYGGYNPFNVNATDYGVSQLYDLDCQTWTQKASLFPGRRQLSCAMDVNYQYIYGFGGRDENENIFDKIIRYNIADDSWDTLSETLQTPRYEFVCRLFPINANIYCFGGITANNPSFASTNEVEIFDPITESITGNVFMIEDNGRSLHTVNVIDTDCMIIIGGGQFFQGTGRQSDTSFFVTLNTIEYFGNCSNLNFMSAPAEACDCYNTSLVSRGIFGPNRCYRYEVSFCNDRISSVILGQAPTENQCGVSDISDIIQSIQVPDYVTVESDERFLTLDGLMDGDRFRVCFDKDLVEGTMNGGSIVYIDSSSLSIYQCPAAGILYDVCGDAPMPKSAQFIPQNEVKVFEGNKSETKNGFWSETSMMIYMWTALCSALVSVTIVFILYVSCIKPKAKGVPVYDKVDETEDEI